MFSEHDVALNHVRRYTKKELMDAVAPDLTVRRASYFVCVLFPAAALTRAARRLANRLPIKQGSRNAVRKQSTSMPGLLDIIFRRTLYAEVKLLGGGTDLPFGLSVLCVAQKTNQAGG